MDNKEDDFIGFNENVEENDVIDNQNNSSSKKYKIFIVIFISVLVIAAAIALLYFFYFKDKDKDKDKDKYNDNEIENEVEDRLLQNYTFKAVYYTESNKTEVRLCKNPEEILELNIDGINFYNINSFIFNNSGSHIVYILLNLEKMDSLGVVFYANRYLKSVYFAKKFKNFKYQKIEFYVRWLFIININRFFKF